MKPFTTLYDRCLRWAADRRAGYYLGALSFAESSFFPIPPDVMLAPMTLARPDRGMYFAALTTVTSVLGGVFGYLVGYFAFDMAAPFIDRWGYMEGFERARLWFAEWGFWAVFVAGFSPIPYKIFTIAAGVLSLFLPLFIVASLIGRGLRFFLVAGVVMWAGGRMQRELRRYVEWLGWLTVALIMAAIIYKTIG